MPKVRYILRVLVGIFFIVSAVAKFLSIDSFEIYLFSFELLPLPIAFIAARCIIGVEAILGVWFLLNINYKTTNILTYLMLGLFSGFLFGDIIAGNRENCHCLGELVNLAPLQSLIKNAILILLVILSQGKRLFVLKQQTLISVVSATVIFAAIFVVSPPDSFRYDSYKSGDMLNEEYFEHVVKSGEITSQVFEGEKVVCFFSVRCEYCAMSAKKLGILRRLGDFSRAEIISFFGKGETTTLDDAEAFISDAVLDCNDVHFIKPDTFLKITNGEFPLILLIKDGKVMETYSYRDLH